MNSRDGPVTAVSTLMETCPLGSNGCAVPNGGGQQRGQAATSGRGLYVDGGCSCNWSSNPKMRQMVAVVTDIKGKVLVEQMPPLGGSNNIAELLAVTVALEYCVSKKIRAVRILTDRRNNLSWAKCGALGSKLNDREAVLALQARILATRAHVTATLDWVPRDRNLAGHYIERTHAL